MAYLTVENFNAGMDRRRERVAGPAGSLWLAKNMHVTRGGDLERRKKFVAAYSVPGTFHAATLRSQLYVFGSADLAASMPIGVQYQRLIAPSSPAMTAVLDVKAFAGKLYVIAEYANGHVYHFYDATRVTDWDITGATDASAEAVCTLLASKINASSAVTASNFGSTITVQAIVPGTPFTIGGGLTLTQIQANVAAVTEVVASADIQIAGGTSSPGVNRISSVRVNSVELLTGDVDWTSSNSATASRLAAAISNGFTTHGYSATVINDTVTISASPGTGATPNGYAVDVVTHGTVTVVGDATMAGGVTAVTAVAQVYTVGIGAFNTAFTYTVTINGTDYVATGLSSGIGRSLYVDKNRVWSPVGSLERYCKLNEATVWNPAAVGSDAGFLNIASQSEGNEQLTVAVRYQDLAAFFSGTDVVLYQLDQDPTKNVFSNVLESTGTEAAKSAVRYGNNDVFYLDLSGIRSLRARDASNAAFVSDVGNQIDPFLLSYVADLTRGQVASAIGAIEPRDGRYWLVIGTRIFVLSFFPGAKISAWSYYEAEEFGDDPVQAVVKVRDRLYARAGDSIYAYGGLAGTTYPDADEVVGEVQTQFLSGSTPATIKDLAGFDFAGTNTWECSVAYDPNLPDNTINIGRIQKITYADANKVKMPGQTSMVSLVLACRKAGPATISMASVHYEGDEAG